MSASHHTRAIYLTCRCCTRTTTRGSLITASDNYVRYGKRHYAHADCYVRSNKPLSKLRKDQLESLPFFVLRECGKLKECGDLIGVDLELGK